MTKPHHTSLHWDLRDLYENQEATLKDQALLTEKAERFALQYKNHIIKGDAATLLRSIHAYEEILSLIIRLNSYGYLQYTTDMKNATRAIFFKNLETFLNKISSILLFYSLEINQIEDKHFATILANKECARYAEWLKNIRKLKKYQLLESEEDILIKKGMTANDAWVRLFDEHFTHLRFYVDGKEYTSTTISELMYDKNEEVRKAASLEFARVLQENSHIFTIITNTLAHDKNTEDNIRKIEHVMKSRNLSNNIEDEVVDNLLQSVQDAYEETAGTYYKLKARLLGKQQLQFWDRNAPLPSSNSEKKYSFEESKRLVLAAYHEFSPKMAEIGALFFDNAWIDVNPAPAKSGGAFAHPTTVHCHPYLMLNHQERIRDVMTLAHELGHGVHQYLARAQGEILSSTPLTLAETASVFGEQLVFRALLKECNKNERLHLLASKIEDMINTVVRQVSFCLFEREVHERRLVTELSTEEISDIWLKTQRLSLGSGIELAKEYGAYWMYIPHFIHSPFYVYAYAFGDCLVNTLYMQYTQTADKEQFAQKYLNMLAQGGSKPYGELLSEFGLDPKRPDFWRKGMQMLKGLIQELEQSL